MGAKRSRRFDYKYQICDGDTVVFEGTSYEIANKYNVCYRTVYNEYRINSLFLGKYRIKRIDNED